MATINLGNVRGPRGFSGLVPKVTATVDKTARGSTGYDFVDIAANTMTDIPVLEYDTSLSLGVGENDHDNEWAFTITQPASQSYEVSMPNVYWGFGMAPMFATNTTTLCRLYYIRNKLCGEWVVVNA